MSRSILAWSHMSRRSGLLSNTRSETEKSQRLSKKHFLSSSPCQNDSQASLLLLVPPSLTSFRKPGRTLLRISRTRRTPNNLDLSLSVWREGVRCRSATSPLVFSMLLAEISPSRNQKLIRNPSSSFSTTCSGLVCAWYQR